MAPARPLRHSGTHSYLQLADEQMVMWSWWLLLVWTFLVVSLWPVQEGIVHPACMHPYTRARADCSVPGNSGDHIPWPVGEYDVYTPSHAFGDGDGRVDSGLDGCGWTGGNCARTQPSRHVPRTLLRVRLSGVE